MLTSIENIDGMPVSHVIEDPIRLQPHGILKAGLAFCELAPFLLAQDQSCVFLDVRTFLPDR